MIRDKPHTNAQNVGFQWCNAPGGFGLFSLQRLGPQT